MDRKYTNLDNYRYIISELKKYNKRIIPFAICEIVAVILCTFEIVLWPALIVGVVMKKAGIDILIKVIVLAVVVFSISFFLKEYLVNRNTWQYLEFRSGYLTRKLMRAATGIKYSEYSNSKKQEEFSIAQESLGSNVEGVEKIIHNSVNLASTILLLIIYCVIFGISSPILVLLVLLSAIIQLVFRYKANNRVYENLIPKAQQILNMNYLMRKATDIAAAKDIRLYNMSNWLKAKYKESNDNYEGIVNREKKIFMKADIAGLVVETICTASCYVYIFFLMQKGLSITGFVFLAGIIQVLEGYLKGIPDKLSETFRYLKEFDYCRNLLEEKIECSKKDESNHKGAMSIEFSHVSFSYPNSKRKILDDICFKVEPGKKIALVGENGAGKSTIINLMCGLYKPTSGKILINGRDISEMRDSEIKAAVCTVFQEAPFWDFTIAENIACLPKEEIDFERIKNAISKTSLKNRIKDLPDKENTYLGATIEKEGVSLSGGEKQKLLIARAVYADRPILLLDEPTAALDAITENELYEEYGKIVEGKTAVYISHRLASTRFCDQILFLKDGKIIEEGTHEELINLEGDYAEMYKTQSSYYR